MKGDDVKYQEAVTRNLASATRSNKYGGSTLPISEIKTKIGIRKDDSRYDDDVIKLINTPKKEQKK